MRIRYSILSGLLWLALNVQAQTTVSSPKVVMQRLAHDTDAERKGDLYYEDTVVASSPSPKELYLRASAWLTEKTGTKIYQDSLTGVLYTASVFKESGFEPDIWGIRYVIRIQVGNGGYALRIAGLRVLAYSGDYLFYDRRRGKVYNIPHREQIYAFTDQKVNELADELRKVIAGVTP